MGKQERKQRTRYCVLCDKPFVGTSLDLLEHTTWHRKQYETGLILPDPHEQVIQLTNETGEKVWQNIHKKIGMH